MASTDLTFADTAAHRAWLASQSALPAGFRVGTATFDFVPVEYGKPASMTVSLISADQPCSSFAAVFTRNAFPGAPVIIGRQRLAEDALQAVVINNKISNVCAPDGVATAEAVCAAVGKALAIPATCVLPSSTGVIGWTLPRADLIAAVPEAVGKLQADSILPLAEGIVTTDLYPKVRRCDLPGGGSIVAVAKGAGMIEPNMATMLAYILTDVAISRDDLRAALTTAVGPSFNAISIDTDQSTSDTVVALSSGLAPAVDPAAFTAALTTVCTDLAEDLVRNGEGVHHVVRCTVSGAPDEAVARAVGKAVINSPLLQCAICGNDPNVGRLVMAVGKELGNHHADLATDAISMAIAGHQVFADGIFHIDQELERSLSADLAAAQLYTSAPDADGSFRPPVDFPPHERVVPIAIDLGLGAVTATVTGCDRTHEYVTENADYRS